MGSIITLGINKMEIDWGKNNTFNDHSKLFQAKDYDKDIPYFYIEDIDDENNYKEKIVYAKGACKKLSDIKDRLDLLGYDLLSCKKLYNEMLKEYEYYTDIKINMTFNEFCSFIKSLDISKINNISTAVENYDNGYDLGEYFNKCILKDNEFSLKMKEIMKKIEKQYFVIGDFFENIDSYIILRILAENELNIDYYVEWRYNDIIENGWAKKEDIIKELEEKNKILIVTEGKTDSFVIKKTLEYLYPNIVDFFKFIDMEENYPFTGVGNLSNFCLGLSKINIQNNIIILFDNDTTGNELYNKVKDIVRPDNLLVCHLPICEEFENFDTIGPSGNTKVDINNKAVAIECFLDFSSVNFKPIIRWNNYNKNMKEYQGELENKEDYIRKFKNANLIDGTYNSEKLRFLIDYIIKSWIYRK